ncbi:translation initiation factor 2 [Aspergillus clavatus NRRL 1]|uniref:Translation initiation factor IF-2, mitochondrial n=1 Tax=Aspergillus clavatus (strain ATCC 1007 / CBS 513.65 / DSM 816 / NCTC 3887 / NRRL 1 / QM 1276 / 107) TaxID=344612 RepID=A1CR07_ASPCL|nr:mitochondrial translation initiation factor, putative [Aspergillus clavatus NRRL 1]EAW08078.1 mitochondrial translation initiation factor, putative [Aspergillus clavatus NRRL 1]
MQRRIVLEVSPSEILNRQPCLLLTAVQLSRRHGPEWSCPARSRIATFTPTLFYVPRRSFRSSLASLDSSSEPPSTPNANEDGSASRPSWGGSKFGGARWGVKQAQKPVVLSPAEQALRDSLVAKKNAEEEAQRQKQEQENAARRNNTNNLRRTLNTHQPERRPGFQKRQPEKKTEQNPRRNGPNLRSIDWICPACNYDCFGKHSICPRCDTPRPGVDGTAHQAARRSMLAEDVRRTWLGGNASKIRKLKQVFDHEPEAQESAQPTTRAEDTRAKAFEQHLGAKGSLPESSSGSEQKPAQQGSDQAQEASEASEKRPQDQEAGKSSKTVADPWTWDQSALEKLQQTYDAEVQQPREAKKKAGRKPREAALEDEEFDPEDDRRRRREDRKRQKKAKARQKELEAAAPSPLYLPEFISVSNLADVIGVRPAQFVQRMEDMGFEDVSYNHILDAETAGLIASEYNFEPIFETGDQDLTAAPELEDKSHLPSRPPVVTIMGHVDHGKTTILDWLRKSSVAASEHGGITQHIGAFSVAMPSGKTITFLDTPGHAAFLDMRRRGANVTDIVVLVVAADDSVKPQTIEAIKHATESNVPIIVAMSKIDREGINTEKVKQDLSVHGVHVEDYGGDVQAIGVSGKTGQGMLELEEAIVTLSEVLDHRADTTGTVEGWVIEATTKSYGRVATALIRRGTLRPGDIIVAGSTWARVRTLRNEAGVAVPEATPGMPVEIDGWREQPSAGTEIIQAEDEQHAKEVVNYRQEKSDTQKLSEDTTAINEARREQVEKRRQEESEGDAAFNASQSTSGPKPVHFIIKADVGGSAEAVLNSVTAIGNNEVYPNVLRSEVGPISEFDIEHAATANGNIISFNMPIDPHMSRMAEMRGVKIMDHNIIYKLIDDVKATLSEELAPSVTQRVTGEAEIGQIFEITLKGREKTAIAGCKVRNGVINRARKVRVLRGQETIYDGSITSLKNVKKDVTEMRKDTECGIGFEGWTDFAVGDHIQCYEEIYEKRYL